MNEKRENEKDEAAYPWFLRTQDRVQYDRIITQRDQALAEADALGKQMSAMDTELRRLEAEVERLRAALEKIGHPKVPPWANFTHGDAARWRQEAFVEFGELARAALADNTRETSDG